MNHQFLLEELWACCDRVRCAGQICAPGRRETHRPACNCPSPETSGQARRRMAQVSQRSSTEGTLAQFEGMRSVHRQPARIGLVEAPGAAHYWRFAPVGARGMFSYTGLGAGRNRVSSAARDRARRLPGQRAQRRRFDAPRPPKQRPSPRSCARMDGLPYGPWRCGTRQQMPPPPRRPVNSAVILPPRSGAWANNHRRASPNTSERATINQHFQTTLRHQKEADISDWAYCAHIYSSW